MSTPRLSTVPMTHSPDIAPVSSVNTNSMQQKASLIYRCSLTTVAIIFDLTMTAFLLSRLSFQRLILELSLPFVKHHFLEVFSELFVFAVYRSAILIGIVLNEYTLSYIFCICISVFLYPLCNAFYQALRLVCGSRGIRLNPLASLADVCAECSFQCRRCCSVWRCSTPQ